MRALIVCLLAASAGAAQSPPLRLVRELTLDAGTGVPFGVITAMDLGPDGSIVAVDDGNGRIYRFTPAGRLRDSLSRKGQGPGEFLSSVGVAVGPAGELALADIRARRLTLWNADGTLRGSAAITEGMPIDILWRSGPPVLGTLRFEPGMVARATFAPMTLEGALTPGAPIASFIDPRKEQMVTAVTCGMCRRALSPEGQLVGAAPDTIYRLSRIGTDGTAGAGWQRSGVGAGLRTDEEVAALERRLAAGPGSGRPNPEGRPMPVIPRGDIRFRPRVQGLGFDASGRLLALVSNAGSTMPVVDVFAAGGAFLGTIRPAERLTAFVVRGRRAIGLGETADGEHVIHVYRIEEVP